VIVSANRVLKSAGRGQGSVARELANYTEAVACWPVLAEVLAPIELRRESVGTFLLMDRYEQVDDNTAVLHAVRLFRLMQGCRNVVASSFDVAATPQVAAGIEVLSDLYGTATGQLVRRRLKQLSPLVDFDLGFAHGDFHSRNIVLDSSGAARLIDLDCARMNGVQQLDALYFVMESEWSTSGRQWFEQIAAYLRNELPKGAQIVLNQFGVTSTGGLALIYLLDRIGQEATHYGFRYRPAHLAEAVVVLERSAA
jgi:hypothetical protein